VTASIETIDIWHWPRRTRSAFSIAGIGAVLHHATSGNLAPHPTHLLSPRLEETTMAKGYWMFHTTVTDAETYRKYVERDGEAFNKYGARFLARGGEFQVVEGTSKERHVIVEFDSYEAALACFHSREYQSAPEFRQTAAVTDLVIIKGTA
jgi:uncharacterized protein (DUF1330 family)